MKYWDFHNDILFGNILNEWYASIMLDCISKQHHVLVNDIVRPDKSQLKIVVDCISKQHHVLVNDGAFSETQSIKMYKLIILWDLIVVC